MATRTRPLRTWRATGGPPCRTCIPHSPLSSGRISLNVTLLAPLCSPVGPNPTICMKWDREEETPACEDLPASSPCPGPNRASLALFGSAYDWASMSDGAVAPMSRQAPPGPRPRATLQPALSETRDIFISTCLRSGLLGGSDLGRGREGIINTLPAWKFPSLLA